MYSASGAPPWQSHRGYGQPNGHPAYISVPTPNNPYSSSSLPPPPTYVPQPFGQSTNGHPAAPPPQPTPVLQTPAAGQKKKVEWPPAVREYVGRCFEPDHQIPGIEKKLIEARLRQIITDAASSNKLNSYNWQNMPLPQQMIAGELHRAASYAHSLPPNFIPPPPPPVPLQFVPGSGTPQSSGSEKGVLRKRKSSELSTDIDKSTQVQPPWRSKKGGALEDRMSAPDKRQKFDNGPMSKSHHNLEQRRRRFEIDRPGSSSPQKRGSSPEPAELPGPIVGTMEELEKNYLRLTAPPLPKNVRPLHILRQTLDLLKKKWRQDNDYNYTCDQFKSLRQDLTVQRIKNEFTVSVYEIHARIALEKGDLGEYNQCQSQLRALYRLKLGGHPIEFIAYRILYYIYTCNRTDMNDVLSELTTAEKESTPVKHALAVRSALALGNYHQFFKLYHNMPDMGSYLMDMFIVRERLAALACISKVYKPSVRLRFITEELGFISDEDAAQFILDHGGKELFKEDGDHVRVITGNRLFEDAKHAAFSSIDIRGQI